MIWRWILALLFAPLLALAEVPEPTQALPKRLEKRLQDNPERLLEEAAMLILGHGRGGAIDRAGIDRSIALDRAGLRSRQMRGLLAADLDNDGAVTAAEAETLAASLGSAARGRLLLEFALADGDADGRLTMVELRARAQVMALDELPETRAEQRRSLLALDSDGDGRLTLAEVRAAVPR